MTASIEPQESRAPTSRRIALSPERRLVVDTLHLGRGKPMMHGLLEIDVTRARQLLREHREGTGKAMSFTAFVLACIGRAVGAHPEVHGLRDWLGRVVLYDEVDAATIVEVAVEGRPFPLAHVVRRIDSRSVLQISDELRTVQRRGMRTLSPRMRAGSWFFVRLPGPIRRLFYRVALSFPRLAKQNAGTMLVSSVGMFGGGTGWGLSAPGAHNLSVVVGGIATRASSADGAESREMLCITVSANHELIDGAPLARFVQDLRAQLECADVLMAQD